MALKNVAVYAGYDCYKADVTLVRKDSGAIIIGTIEGDNPVEYNENRSYTVEISDNDQNFKAQCTSEDF